MVGATGATSGAGSTTPMLSLQQHDTVDNNSQNTMTNLNDPPYMDIPPRAGSPLSEEEHSDFNESESSWDSDDYEHDSRRTRQPQTHLAIDIDTMRLPSGRVVSSRSAAPSTTHIRLRQQRHTSPEQPSHSFSDTHFSYNASSSPTTASPVSNLSPTNDPLTMSKRSHKRQTRFTTLQEHHLRPSDQQALASLTSAQQRSLLATTQKQIESAQRVGREFVGKMDAFGNIKSKERFVNDVPGGKAHKNRFFAR